MLACPLQEVKLDLRQSVLKNLIAEWIVDAWEAVPTERVRWWAGGWAGMRQGCVDGGCWRGTALWRNGLGSMLCRAMHCNHLCYTQCGSC